MSDAPEPAAAAPLPRAPIKLGFVLLSPSAAPIPSTRIAALNMFAFLREAGFDPQIVFDPAQPSAQPQLAGLAQRVIAERFRIVVLQKVQGPDVERFAHALRAAGIRTVWLVCDFVDPAMARCVDATVVVTNYLKSLYPAELQARIHVVHDGIERPEVHKTGWGDRPATRSHPLRAVLVTSFALDRIPVLELPPPWLRVQVVGRYPPQRDWAARLRAFCLRLAEQPPRERLRYATLALSPRIRRQAWDAERVYRSMLQADVGIIPIDTTAEHLSGATVPAWRVKSENRLTLKMALALPVLATPIPSYEAVIEPGRTGFLARSRREWIEQLDALREPALRRAVGTAARQAVLERYSMREQARRLVKVLNGLLD